MKRKERIAKRPWACDFHRGEDVMTTRCRFFELGLNRTGTRSICIAAGMLGLNAIHGLGACYPCMKDMVRKMKRGRCNFIPYDHHEYAGHPSSAFWRELAEERPDAKFILPTRPLESWITSVMGSSQRHKVRNRVKRFDELYFSRMYGTIKPERHHFVSGFSRHYNEVRDYFRGSDRLLELSVFEMGDDELWSKLAEFVGAEPPPSMTPFPHQIHPITKYRWENRPNEENDLHPCSEDRGHLDERSSSEGSP